MAAFTGLHLRILNPRLAVGSIALDPSNHSTIYVGTGEENFSGDSYYGAGILKSTNGGTSWTQIKGPFVGPFSSSGYFGGGARIGAIAVEPGNSSVILAAVEMFSSNPTGIYRTADGGTTWTNILSGALRGLEKAQQVTGRCVLDPRRRACLGSNGAKASAIRPRLVVGSTLLPVPLIRFQVWPWSIDL